MKTFEEFLGERFLDLREIGGVPITKENFEDMFSTWLEELESQELIDYADRAIGLARIGGMEECLNKMNPLIKNLSKSFKEYEATI